MHCSGEPTNSIYLLLLPNFRRKKKEEKKTKKGDKKKKRKKGKKVILIAEKIRWYCEGSHWELLDIVFT